MRKQDMNVKLETPIAYGRTAEIYKWQNGQVLKLFHDWFGLEAIHYEQRINQAVHASGLPVPAVGEIIRVNDRNGLLYEYVAGSTMWEMMRPWNTFRFALQMAELHTEMHASTIEIDIPSQHQNLRNKINAAEVLPADLREKSLAELDSMPAGNQLCHGDFHPGNIMVSGQEVIIVDWIDATLGNPLADLARTTILFQGAVETRQILNPWHRIMIRAMHARYKQHYFTRCPGGEQEYARWLSINAAARLSEGIPELETWLIEQAANVH
jgi:uncharacterized protein (TIGR02172 family)